MSNYKEIVCETLNSYKCKSKEDEYRTIPIYNEDILLGFLKPITYLYKQLRPEYISLFCKWRQENMFAFSNVFQNTTEKTEYWLDNILLPREDRILFAIHTVCNKPIGHIGLSTFNFQTNSCEIDNVIRGVQEGSVGIMHYSTITLMRWGYSRLKVKDYYLRVISDNFHAIKFYEKTGFKKLYDIPLFKVEKQDITEWIELENNDGVPDKYYTYMKWT